jgi:hypothetical protein
VRKTLNVQKHSLRPIRFLGLHEIGEWQVKLYGISSLAERPAPEFTPIALELAQACLPGPPVTEIRYGIAFVTIHQAEAFNQIIVDWWEYNNELRHRVFKAMPTSPTTFKDITATGEAFCVWELAVICHERNAWIRHVLQDVPNVDSYLEDVISGEL